MGAVNQTATQLAEELAGTGSDPSTISQLIEDFTSQIATSALDLATSSKIRALRHSLEITDCHSCLDIGFVSCVLPYISLTFVCDVVIQLYF